MDRFAPAAAALDALAARYDVGLLLLDSSGRVDHASALCLELLGCPDGRALEEAWPQLRTRLGLDPAGLPSVTGARSIVADLEQPGHVARRLRVECRPSAPAGYEVLLKDRRRLGALDLAMVEAFRMRSWGYACETLLHDANGALNTIQLTLELLDGEWPGDTAHAQAQPPHRASHIDVIRANLQKLKATLRPLGTLAEEAARPARYDTRDPVNAVVAQLRMQARRHRVDLQAEVPQHALIAEGYECRLRQAIGCVVLSRLQSAPERSRMLVQAEAAGACIGLAFFDDGPLPDEQALAQMFQLLFVDDATGSGRTDGLRLARAIVECEGGELQVAATRGDGPVMRMTLPAVA
jgi:signal transduction histidine kinase